MSYLAPFLSHLTPFPNTRTERARVHVLQKKKKTKITGRREGCSSNGAPRWVITFPLVSGNAPRSPSAVAVLFYFQHVKLSSWGVRGADACTRKTTAEKVPELDSLRECFA